MLCGRTPQYSLIVFPCAHIPDSTCFYKFYTAQQSFRVFCVFRVWKSAADVPRKAGAALPHRGRGLCGGGGRDFRSRRTREIGSFNS